MHPKICFLDRDVRPSPRNQLLMTDNFAGALYQGGQKIERSTANRNRLVALLQ
jgi:hypothetical protein